MVPVFQDIYPGGPSGVAGGICRTEFGGKTKRWDRGIVASQRGKGNMRTPRMKVQHAPEGDRGWRPMGEDDIIEVRDLEHAFNGVKAVRGISFSVRRGRDLLLPRPPTARGRAPPSIILTTLLPFQRGTVRVAGYDVAREPERRSGSPSVSSSRTSAWTRPHGLGDDGVPWTSLLDPPR